MDDDFVDTTLAGNERIEEAIHYFYQEQTEHRFMGICMAVRERIAHDGHLLFPVEIGQDEEGCQTYEFKTLELDGQPVIVAFTSVAEKEKGPAADCNDTADNEHDGKEDIALILNPGSERFA